MSCKLLKKASDAGLLSLPNLITLSRVIFSAALLIAPAFSALFFLFYILCGVSDILDGFTARRLKLQTELGETLDSLADLIFAVCCFISVYIKLDIGVFIWVWTGLIAALKLYTAASGFLSFGVLYMPHSPANKLTGILLFLFPAAARVFGVAPAAVPVCAAASYAAIRDLAGLARGKHS